MQLMACIWLAIQFWTAAVILAGTAAMCLGMVACLGKLLAVLHGADHYAGMVPGTMQASLMLMLMTAGMVCTVMPSWVRTTKVFLGRMAMYMIRCMCEPSAAYHEAGGYSDDSYRSWQGGPLTPNNETLPSM